MTLDEFLLSKQMQTGWIDPIGEFHLVSLYEHLGFLKSNPRYRPLVEILERIAKNAEESHAEFAERFGPNDHVEWHAYDYEWEDLESFLRSLIMATAYRDGWTRIYLDTFRKRVNVEALPETLHRLGIIRKLTKGCLPGYEVENHGTPRMPLHDQGEAFHQYRASLDQIGATETILNHLQDLGISIKTS